MLRLIVLLLTLANAGYYAWSHDLLAAYGFAPASQTEPQRMAQQIKPEALRILTPQQLRQIESASPAAALVPASAQASSSASPASSSIASSSTFSTSTASLSTATECLQAGLFNEEQTLVLRERLTSALPAGSWELQSAVDPGRWLVYMGKYNSADAVTKKKAELRGLGVSFETLRNAALEPGLSLGSFKAQSEADAELARVAKKGVKTAKVIQEKAEQRGQRLKLAKVNPALRSQLDAIKPQLAGKAFQTCS
jgi:hypothetical protein